MRLTRSMSIGAGLGFVMGIVFTITSLFLYDEAETSAGYVIASGLLIGMPILVAMGTLAGWLWDVFIAGKKR
jgi:hypothetical protein